MPPDGPAGGLTNALANGFAGGLASGVSTVSASGLASSLIAPMAFAFVLTLCRVSAAVMLLPGLGEEDLPSIVRAGIAVALSAVLMPVVQPLLPPMPGSPFGLLALIGGELLAGGLLGWLARLLAMALPVAAQIMSTMIGLANVLQPDPALGAQTTGLSRMMSLAAPVLVLASGLYVLPIEALAGSYRVLRPGTFPLAGDMAGLVTDATAHCFGLALQLSAPFVIASGLWQVMLGVLARVVPALQVNNLAAPVQLFGGLALAALLVRGVVGVWMGAMQSGFATLPGLCDGGG